MFDSYLPCHNVNNGRQNYILLSIFIDVIFWRLSGRMRSSSWKRVVRDERIVGSSPTAAANKLFEVIMSKHKPKGHIYICLCDVFRPSRTGFTMQKSKIWERPYRGRYIVNAKNEKHALEVLRKLCPFGSLQVYYQQDDYPIQPEFGEAIKQSWQLVS